MKLTQEAVKKLADLSQLDMSEAELQEFPEQLSSILSYAEMMQEVDTGKIAEVQQTQTFNYHDMREDVVAEQSAETVKDLQDAMPERSGDYCSVPKVL
jgi:aspartyl-tRNA(Asn)/glutamyl-tRNA(Gln) amidotransferase subunit C